MKELKDKKVLVVDDSLTIRMQVKEVLESAGISVTLAEDGQDCLNVLTSLVPDVILLDYVLPDTDGLSLYKKIQEVDTLREVPVLLLTGVTDTEQKVSALQAGINDYINKPFSVEELEKRVGALLELRTLKSQLKLCEHRLENSDKYKEEFLANINHEIRTPMNAIIGYTRLIQKYSLPETVRTYVRNMLSSANSLMNLVNSLIDFADLKNNNLTLINEEFVLDDLLSQITRHFAGRAEDKHIELLYSVGINTPQKLKGDYLRLKEILIQLLDNALKFTHEGEVLLSVTYNDESDSFTFAVEDTGIGLEEEDFKLYTTSPFIQKDGSFSRLQTGIGIGLSLSAKIVELMGGVLALERLPIRGSRFYFTVPLEVIKKSSTPKEKIMQSDYHNYFSKISVLLVDDSETFQTIIREMLLPFVSNVTTVCDVPEALASIRNRDGYDVIFLDWNLKGTSSVSLLQELSDDELFKKTKIVLVTAYTYEEVMNDFKDFTIHGFLSKPVCQSKLFDSLMECFSEQMITHISTSTLKDSSVNVKKSVKVLLVEDNPLNQEIATELLKEVVPSVTVAENGEEALKIIEKQDFDLVFLDIHMPKMDGFEVTRRIRNVLSLKDLPIVALTADTLPSDIVRCFDLGMNDYLSKPIDLVLLKEKVFRWIPELKQKSNTKNIQQEVLDVKEEISPDNSELDTLPDSLLGINIKLAESRYKGHYSIFHKTIQMFCKEYKESAIKLKTLISDNNWKELAILLHTLKGCVGNFCAEMIMKICEDMEICIRNNNYSHLDSLLELFTKHFNEMVDSVLDTYLKREDRNLKITPSQKDASFILEDEIEKLKTALESQIPTEVNDCITRIISHIDTEEQQQFFYELETFTKSFQFSSALELLQKGY